MKSLKAIVNWVLAYEAIDGDGAVDRYLNRWRLLAVPGLFKVYLHHFVGDDWSRDLHDHPKHFWSIGVRGGYVESTRHPDGGPIESETYYAPWFRSVPPEHVHRLTLAPGCTSCWTLVVVGREQRRWGFYTDDGWVPWFVYVDRERRQRERAGADRDLAA